MRLSKNYYYFTNIKSFIVKCIHILIYWHTNSLISSTASSYFIPNSMRAIATRTGALQRAGEDLSGDLSGDLER